MKMLGRILLLLLILVLLVVIGGTFFILDITRGPLPQHSGEITVAGLRDRVEIIRDGTGIPHIYASNLHDLFFAQGYTQAQDRWWQMEFGRRAGKGQIQQLTGRSASVMGTDIFIRTVGWRRAAERELNSYDPAVMQHLQSFADGVNAYIMNRAPDDLAMEYSVLGLTGVEIPIDAWTPLDTLVWAKLMQDDLGGNYGYEILREQLIGAIGEDLFNDWFNPWPFGEFPTIAREEDLPAMGVSGTAAGGVDVVMGAGAKVFDASLPEGEGAGVRVAGNLTLGEGFFFGSASSGVGSNNWVVSGSRTASGRPLIANDPHLTIRMPSIWYEIGLHCQPVSADCPLNVQGFTFAPNPAVVVGHNERIAWAVTNVGPDTQDLYRLEINPENELQYRWNGEWRDMTVYDEEIRFGDGELPVTIQVRETHFGPVINDNQIDEATGDILGFNNEDPLAMRWTSLEGSTLFESVLGLNSAQNWDEFREALRLWDSPAQNFVYADLDGNIGYQMPGSIPIRAPGESGLVPSDCAEDACMWQGYLPFDILPTVYNPERGYIATANQAVIPLEYYAMVADELGGEPEQYIISHEWDIGYRGARISEMIEASDQHTLETMAAIHGDNQMIAAEVIASSLQALPVEDAALAEMRDWMLEWDYQLHMGSPRALLWMLWFERLTDNTFNDQLAMGDYLSSGAPYELFALTQLVNEADNLWWDDVDTAGVTETRDEVMLRSLSEAVAQAQEQFGTNRDAWRWGTLHTLEIVSNPLGLSGIDLIENIVNRGPIETSGGHVAVNATNWNFGARGFRVRGAPSMRMILDVGAFDNSQGINATGQSGHPFSAQYADQVEPWRNLEYHALPFTREAVEAAAAARLTLRPG
ncbi:MAG: penicillin acylase family protein [Chloroflexota bacterium]|nr:penicillin acylase family protein [Chloroflexota bacterium]